jgi:hypothetical protein
MLCIEHENCMSRFSGNPCSVGNTSPPQAKQFSLVEWAFGVSLNTSEITCGFDKAHCSPHGQLLKKI